MLGQESGRVAWWRVVPKGRRPDVYARRFKTSTDAEALRVRLAKHARDDYEIVGYSESGKRVRS